MVQPALHLVRPEHSRFQQLNKQRNRKIIRERVIEYLSTTQDINIQHSLYTFIQRTITIIIIIIIPS